jgi:hypothetical protein
VDSGAAATMTGLAEGLDALVAVLDICAFRLFPGTI